MYQCHTYPHRVVSACPLLLGNATRSIIQSRSIPIPPEQTRWIIRLDLGMDVEKTILESRTTFDTGNE
jgi:hypothetical protein